MRRELRRRFTLKDAAVLVAAVAVGFALARAHQTSLIAVAQGFGGAGVFPWTIRRLGLVCPLFASLSLGLIVLRFLGPRPCWRRLVGSPGFAACYAVALGLAITVLTCFLDVVAFHFGYRNTPLYLWNAHMRALDYASLSVAATWFTLALIGRWRRNRFTDWVEYCGLATGILWLVLLAARHLNV